MGNPQYVRAVYDAERNSYISTQAAWVNGESILEYRFMAMESDEEPGLWEGGLEKFWHDEEGHPNGEFFAFDEYETEADFDADVKRILDEARKVSDEENIDEFLAVTDIVKQRAIDSGFVDDSIEDLEGLFEDGPEDAYTLTDIGDEPRLHHHVERDDECWFFHIAPVVDQQEQPLGWGLFVIHFPELGRDATEADLQNVQHAEVLLLDQLQTKSDALLATKGFRHYMETERLDDPYFAFANDTEVFENAVFGAEWHDQAEEVVWQEYDNQTLQALLTGKLPYRLPREQWQPGEESLADRFFKDHPQPVWFEDQFRAMLDEEAGDEPDEDEDSPWQNLDLE